MNIPMYGKCSLFQVLLKFHKRKKLFLFFNIFNSHRGFSLCNVLDT